VSATALMKFIAGQILHGNVNAREEIRYRSVVGKGKFDVSAADEKKRFHWRSPILNSIVRLQLRSMYGLNATTTYTIHKCEQLS